jgi:recombinational DNA repair ATPase RecF
MQIDLTLRNYRCFPDTRPMRISLGSGLTAFIGVNNSGKSSLLKFFYEFRNLFSLLSAPQGGIINALHEGNPVFSYPASITDMNEVFSSHRQEVCKWVLGGGSLRLMIPVALYTS